MPALYAGVAGLSLVEEVGARAIEAHVRGLVDRLLDGLEAFGATVPTPRDPSRRGPLVCVRSSDVTALVGALAAERMIVSSREDKLRVALHLYNVDEDVDRLLEALARHRALLAVTTRSCPTTTRFTPHPASPTGAPKPGGEPAPPGAGRWAVAVRRAAPRRFLAGRGGTGRS